MSGLRPGVFQLVARAKHRKLFVRPGLALSGRPLTGLRVQLKRGATVHGTVSGREPDEQYSLVFFGPKGVKTARVDSADGSYELTSPEPGEYHVLARKAGASDGRREQAELSARRKRGWPDVVISEGTRHRYDIDAKATVLGSLRGRVDHNGRPAPGFEVRLTREQQAPGGSPRSSSSRLRAPTDAKGAFIFAFLEPGAYALEVAPGARRKSRSRRGPWYRERILVSAGRSLDRRIQVGSADVKFHVVNATSGQPVPRARISMALAAEVGGRDPKQWRKLTSVQRITVRDGLARVEEIAPGPYVYTVSGSGLTPEPLPLSIHPGEISVVVRVKPKVRPPGAGSQRPGGRPPGGGKQPRKAGSGKRR